MSDTASAPSQATPTKAKEKTTTARGRTEQGHKRHESAKSAKSAKARNGVAITKGSANPQQKASPAGSQKPKQSAKAPTPAQPTSGKAIFNIAKGICSNPAMLQSVPEGIRGDDDAVAKYAEVFAPPGRDKQAHDGCLAGLKSLGR